MKLIQEGRNRGEGGKKLKAKDKIKDCIANKRKNKRKKLREENREEKMLKTSNGFDLVTARDTEKSNRKKGETMLHRLDDGLPSHIM